MSRALDVDGGIMLIEVDLPCAAVFVRTSRAQTVPPPKMCPSAGIKASIDAANWLKPSGVVA